jgi:hypothetical protein
MIRYLRIAILALIATAVMPTPHGMAEDIGGPPRISTKLGVPPLIRVQNAETRECRRQCDAVFAACVAEIRELKQQGARDDALNRYGAACFKEHEDCYRTC